MNKTKKKNLIFHYIAATKGKKKTKKTFKRFAAEWQSPADFPFPRDIDLFVNFTKQFVGLEKFY